jgi:hypothetical protein
MNLLEYNCTMAGGKAGGDPVEKDDDRGEDPPLNVCISFSLCSSFENALVFERDAKRETVIVVVVLVSWSLVDVWIEMLIIVL